MKEIYEFNTDKMVIPQTEPDLLACRAKLASGFETAKENPSEVTIVVLAYNKLEKTRACLESVFKYTKNIDYDLILIDNGSTDETFDYFKSLNSKKIRIIHLSQNIECLPPFYFIDHRWISKYMVVLMNDVVVTEHWLDNMLICIRSDEKIGFVEPLTTNSALLSTPPFAWSNKNISDFQKKASEFNVSNPAKWQERIDLLIEAALFSKECLLAIGWPFFDPAFLHNYGDVEVTFRVRRAGYKAILAGDTVVHHNHDYSSTADAKSDDFNKSDEYKRKNFNEKFLGVNVWCGDDINFVAPLIADAISEPADKGNVRILGVDTNCGQPILDIKNSIRKYGIFDPEVYAFSQDVKYYVDLKTCCNNDVVCGKIDSLVDSFEKDSFDYIIIGQNINSYPDYLSIVCEAYSLLKKGGQLFITLRNIYNASTLFCLLGYNSLPEQNIYAISLNQFTDELVNVGIGAPQWVNAEGNNLGDNAQKIVNDLIDSSKPEEVSRELITRDLMINRYWLKITKGDL